MQTSRSETMNFRQNEAMKGLIKREQELMRASSTQSWLTVLNAFPTHFIDVKT